MMPILTIWQKSDKVQVVQLSDEAFDGTPSEQITYLKNLYQGYVCVSENYQGTFPDSDSSLWQWDNGIVITREFTNDEKMQLIKNELNKLEQEALMPRGAREAFIALCLQQGQAAGLNPAQLYSANPFFKGLKDTDAVASNLRAQIKAIS